MWTRAEPHWRQPKDMPPSRQKIISPYDTEARFSVRRSTRWQGYRVHVTETCDEDQPLLITNVETTTSASLDLEWTDTIHQHLQEKDLLPKDHLVDAGYVDARALAEGRSIYGLDLIGPTKPDPSWQARRGELYGIASFVIDWEKEQVTCPQGQVSLGWYPAQNPYGEPVVVAQWATAVCRACPTRRQCVRILSRHGPSSFFPRSDTLPCNRLGSDRQRTNSRKPMHNALGWKVRSPKAHRSVVYAALGTEGWPRPVYSMCSRRWPST